MTMGDPTGAAVAFSAGDTPITVRSPATAAPAAATNATLADETDSPGTSRFRMARPPPLCGPAARLSVVAQASSLQPAWNPNEQPFVSSSLPKGQEKHREPRPNPCPSVRGPGQPGSPSPRRSIPAGLWYAVAASLSRARSLPMHLTALVAAVGLAAPLA